MPAIGECSRFSGGPSTHDKFLMQHRRRSVVIGRRAKRFGDRCEVSSPGRGGNTAALQHRGRVGRRGRAVPAQNPGKRNVGNQNAGRAPAPSAIALFGEAVPPSVTLQALPANVTGQIPMLKPYAYTILGKQLLIVNPADRKVVDVITQ